MTEAVVSFADRLRNLGLSNDPLSFLEMARRLAGENRPLGERIDSVQRQIPFFPLSVECAEEKDRLGSFHLSLSTAQKLFQAGRVGESMAIFHRLFEQLKSNSICPADINWQEALALATTTGLAQEEYELLNGLIQQAPPVSKDMVHLAGARIGIRQIAQGMLDRKIPLPDVGDYLFKHCYYRDALAIYGAQSANRSNHVVNDVGRLVNMAKCALKVGSIPVDSIFPAGDIT